MRIVITGGQGFLGQELCKLLLKNGAAKDSSGTARSIEGVTLFDVAAPRDPSAGVNGDPKVTCVSGDITDLAVCKGLVEGSGPLSIIHLAGVMSGQAEKDFDVGLQVNLYGTINMLEACRAWGKKPKFLFASSMAVFGETYDKDAPISDTNKIVPKNTYGMTKACGELMVNDYSRKGFIDGRTARLPTVVVRPGAPNAASTSCYSGVVREPLHGVDVELPVARNLPHAVSTTRALLTNLVILHDCTWPEGLVDRGATLPSIPATLQDLIDALYAAVPEEERSRLGKITDKEDKFLSGVVGSMSANMSSERGVSLGMVKVPDLTTAVLEFLEDFGDKVVVTRPNKKQRVS